MSAPVKYFEENTDKWNGKNVKIVFVGRKDRFPTPTLDAINKIMLKTENNTALTLNVAFDYGGRNDILETTKLISSRVKDGLINLEDITDSYFAKNLNVVNDVDLLIRTSGELRISNFLLWQMAYAEFYFTKCLWPDFSKRELIKAILSFQKRNRRFGAISDEVKR
jgi:undecaprenyl diphosphate synthase